ncbi:hypothetical protein DIPPA_26165 [Diplonema papillatum]|nr:hypothetical protein DIPPA_26165 [Diplonema papillatum]
MDSRAPSTVKGATEGTTDDSVQPVDYDITTVTVFRFPFMIVLTALVIGCTLSDAMVDNFLEKDSLTSYYSAVAKLGPYALVMNAYCLLGAGLLLNLLLRGFKLQDVISLFVLGVVFAIRCTQVYPAVRKVAAYSLKGDSVALGKIPAQLRILHAFNLVQPVLLILIAVVQLYSYVVYVSSGTVVDKKKRD